MIIVNITMVLMSMHVSITHAYFKCIISLYKWPEKIYHFNKTHTLYFNLSIKYSDSESTCDQQLALIEFIPYKYIKMIQQHIALECVNTKKYEENMHKVCTVRWVITVC